MADQPLDLTCPPRYWPVHNGNKSPPVTSEFSKLSVNIPVSGGNKGDIRSSVIGNNGSNARRFSNCSSDNVSLTSDRPLSLSPSSAGYSRNDSGSESPIIDNRRRLGGDSHGGKTIGDSDCMSSAGSHSDYESGEGSPSPKAMHRSSPPVVDSSNNAASPPLATSGPATKRFLTKYIEEHKGIHTFIFFFISKLLVFRN